ncbi:MAG TPA: UvrD-helicase domain-containing protein [bacterium]|nr:UvrD-helicase domain-containing protein [bacterium]
MESSAPATGPIPEIDALLNAVQRDAVHHGDGPLLVLAGAGSGKTRVLTYRIAALIRERSVAPQRILAVTFTNKAAGEMRERVERLVGRPIARAVWMGTFHATCSRILRRSGAPIGIDPRFLIYDTDDQRALVREVTAALHVDDRQFPPIAVLAAIGRAKNELLDHVAVAARAETFRDEVIAKLYAAYQRRLDECHALDFDDLLMRTVILFREHPQTLAEYQDRFRHILVDEYQDTNHAQYALLSVLAARHRNVCVVGDDDQAIYRWRGADVRNILEFERDYPDARVIKLEQNYRSTRRILEAASALVRHNPHRHTKVLWTENEEGEPVALFEAFDGYDEARYTGEVARAHRSAGGHAGDLAILYRTNAQSRQFEEMFLRLGIPYQIVGALRFYERAEVKDMLAYLRFVYNQADEASLRRIVNVPRRGIGDGTLRRLEAWGKQAGLGLWDTLRRGEDAGVGPQARRALAEFAGVVEGLVRYATDHSARETLAQAIDATGYRRMLEAEGTDEAYARIENLDELGAVAEEVEVTVGESTLEAFLQHLALVTDVDTWEDRADRVTLMTLHSAKGLEFPVVVLAGLEEGLFPHVRSIEEEAGIEEERRLCYVGMTRAKRRLILTYARQRAAFGTARPSLPSRFLAEIPENLLARAVTAKTAVNDWTEERGPVPEIAVGDHVRHKTFGAGRVLEMDGEGPRAIITVRFDGVGTKRLALGYAPLEVVRDSQGGHGR